MKNACSVLFASFPTFPRRMSDRERALEESLRQCRLELKQEKRSFASQLQAKDSSIATWKENTRLTEIDNREKTQLIEKLRALLTASRATAVNAQMQNENESLKYERTQQQEELQFLKASITKKNKRLILLEKEATENQDASYALQMRMRREQGLRQS